MNGLRVYMSPQNAAAQNGEAVFYSRRENGPYYRWCYEASLNHWCVARVHSSDFSPKALSATNWKVVPTDLQKSMVEHYQD